MEPPIHPEPATFVIFGAAAPAARPMTDYTQRVMPYHDGVEVPLESARILWQR